MYSFNVSKSFRHKFNLKILCPLELIILLSKLHIHQISVKLLLTD